MRQQKYTPMTDERILAIDKQWRETGLPLKTLAMQWNTYPEMLSIVLGRKRNRVDPYLTTENEIIETTFSATEKMIIETGSYFANLCKGFDLPSIGKNKTKSPTLHIQTTV